jgi:hypothetical protein
MTDTKCPIQLLQHKCATQLQLNSSTVAGYQIFILINQISNDCVANCPARVGLLLNDGPRRRRGRSSANFIEHLRKFLTGFIEFPVLGLRSFLTQDDKVGETDDKVAEDLLNRRTQPQTSNFKPQTFLLNSHARSLFFQIDERFQNIITIV